MTSPHGSPGRCSMSVAAIALITLALCVGLVVGTALASRRRPTDAGLRTDLQLHAGELRRLADQGAQRELAAEQLRQGLDGARRALDELRTRDQERRAQDTDQREVVKRL